VLLCLLQLCGDISPNPGPTPVNYPCIVCSKPVDNHTIQCSGCQQWTHTHCAGVSDFNCEEFCAWESFDWFCPMCLFDQLPNVDISALSTTCDDSCDGGDEMQHVNILASTCDVLCGAFHGIRIVYHTNMLVSSHSTMKQYCAAKIEKHKFERPLRNHVIMVIAMCQDTRIFRGQTMPCHSPIQ